MYVRILQWHWMSKTQQCFSDILTKYFKRMDDEIIREYFWRRPYDVIIDMLSTYHDIKRSRGTRHVFPWKRGWRKGHDNLKPLGIAISGWHKCGPTNNNAKAIKNKKRFIQQLGWEYTLSNHNCHTTELTAMTCSGWSEWICGHLYRFECGAGRSTDLQG